jgi:hypothetical protein
MMPNADDEQYRVVYDKGEYVHPVDRTQLRASLVDDDGYATRHILVKDFADSNNAD